MVFLELIERLQTENRNARNLSAGTPLMSYQREPSGGKVISVGKFRCFSLAGVLALSSCVTGNTNSVHSDSSQVVRDLIYAERTNVKLLADWHPPVKSDPQNNKPAPACVLIHGGGWYRGNKKDMESVASRLSDAGIAVLNITYRLAPKYRFPAPVLDTKDAIRWIKGNARSLGIDSDRICLFGYSAGAHLALMGGFTASADGFDDTNPASAQVYEFNSPKVLKNPPKSLNVSAIVAGGTPSDLTAGDYNEYYEKFFGRPPSEIPETYKAASPITYVRAGLPPVFLYHGKFDWIVDVEQSRRLVDKLRTKNVTVEYLEVTFGHVATFLFDEREVGAAIKFLRSQFKV